MRAAMMPGHTLVKGAVSLCGGFGVHLTKDQRGRYSVIEYKKLWTHPCVERGSIFGLRTENEAAVYFAEIKERLFPKELEL